jgi:hypothetical protein
VRTSRRRRRRRRKKKKPVVGGRSRSAGTRSVLVSFKLSCSCSRSLGARESN